MVERVFGTVYEVHRVQGARQGVRIAISGLVCMVAEIPAYNVQTEWSTPIRPVVKTAMKEIAQKLQFSGEEEEVFEGPTGECHPSSQALISIPDPPLHPPKRAKTDTDCFEELESKMKCMEVAMKSKPPP
ncbi:uncharacterized protein EI90DRAFT_3016925 [Cantharellus anzutake]|uniref:uncharacterized protein n=1 Tax=Cantharellus anzutake TaxID=1750568 RepID=UPI001902F4FE|nr:uncharacterized protein EI90DRAFT_3016925 [Cantharellus anzutake]KAF8330206.1 hypothetical protein EI90DRAFT_3016925 [Cantharellus anzutake]